MTETIPAVLTDESANPRPDSMGFVTSGCKVEIHDSNGARCAADELGEVVVNGTPGITIFGGYFEDPATTAANYRGEWFRTGDRAWRDANGRFFFDGRRSDVLKVAGENVSTVEIESVLCAHPLVLEASLSVRLTRSVTSSHGICGACRRHESPRDRRPAEMV